MRVGCFLLLFFVASVLSIDVEEDSDVDYAVPQLRSPGPAAAVRARQKVHHDSEEAFSDDDLGEIAPGEAAEPATEAQTDETIIPRKMVRKWETQEHFLVEMAFVTLLLLAAYRFVAGKSDNAGLAHNWLLHNAETLSHQFSLVGDSGNFEEKKGPVLVRESPSRLVLYCSGRRNCASALFRLELVDRQDLVSWLASFVFKTSDKLTVTFELEEQDMPVGFCFAVVPSRGHREYKDAHPDLSNMASAKPPGHKGLPKTSVLLCDSEAIALEVLSQPVRELMASTLFTSVHVTDTSPFPDTTRPRIVRFEFKLTSDLAQLDSLLLMALRVVDLVASVKVSEKDLKALKQAREAVVMQVEREKAQMREEAFVRKQMEKKRKEQEALEARMESMNPEQRRKLEQKLAKQQHKRAQSKAKGKMQFVSM